MIALSLPVLLLLNLPAKPKAETRTGKALVFYVSPVGNDVWSGRLRAPNREGSDGPFATIARARDVIRALGRQQAGLKRPVKVLIRAGTYFLSEPVVFLPEDSGTKQCPITYAGYPREHPVISGGCLITGWRPAQVNGKQVWAADLPEVKQGKWYFRQLFVNGERRPRTRLPKQGFYQFTGLPEVTEETPWSEGQTAAQFASGDLRHWQNLSDVEVVALHLWSDSHLPIAGVDEQAGVVRFAQRSVFKLRAAFGPELSRYYVENVVEALDTPGQWYLDRKAGALYYYPLPAEDPSRTEVIAPRLEQLVCFEGDAEAGKFVHDLHLRGLTFSHAEGRLPADLSGYAQAAFNMPGALLLRAAQGCSLRRSAVSHLGCYAIELCDGCQANQVSKNLLTDLGAGGIKVGHGTVGTTLADNEISHAGRIFHSAVGIWIGNSGHNRVVRNHIYDLYYSGISVGWTWGYGPSDAVHNIIENNHIHHLGHGWLSDMGGIYTLGVSPGTRLRGNLIHDVACYAYGGWGIYLDEGSTKILVEKNVVYRTKTGGFHQHYGRENLVQNNVFALSQEPQIARTRAEDHISFTFRRNIVYWRGAGALLGGDWKGSGYRMDHNLYYNADREPLDFRGSTLEEWRARGMDVHSLIADPKFAAPEQGDFNLAPDSPALSLGFRPITLRVPGSER